MPYLLITVTKIYFLDLYMNQSQQSVHQSSKDPSKKEEKPTKQVKTLEEQIMAREIKAVEKNRLEAVFHKLCSLDSASSHTFGTKNIYIMLEQLGYTPARDEVEQMIWEVDEDLDEHINWDEFQLMFKRCIQDTTYLEPRGLFNLVQFLMYDQHGKNKITVEDTLELLFVRCGRQNLDDEIYKIFGQDEKTPDGQEKEITYQEYLAQMKKKDYNNWMDLENKRKKFDPSKEQRQND